MDVCALLTEDDAVSSVLGVVLMVAVTIVLAAVVGTFVLGIGEQLTKESPRANFDYSFTDDSVLILHGGGDQIEADNLEVTVGGNRAWIAGSAQGSFNASPNWDSGSVVTAGDRLRLTGDSSDVNEGESVVIIWTKEGRSAIISEEQIS